MRIVRREKKNKKQKLGAEKIKTEYNIWKARPKKYSEYPYVVTVSFFRRNIFISASDIRGRIKLWSNTGRLGFVGNDKKQYIALIDTAKRFFENLVRYGIRDIFLKFNNFKRTRYAIRKAIKLAKLAGKRLPRKVRASKRYGKWIARAKSSAELNSFIRAYKTAQIIFNRNRPFNLKTIKGKHFKVYRTLKLVRTKLRRKKLLGKRETTLKINKKKKGEAKVKTYRKSKILSHLDKQILKNTPSWIQTPLGVQPLSDVIAKKTRLKIIRLRSRILGRLKRKLKIILKRQKKIQKQKAKQKSLRKPRKLRFLAIWTELHISFNGCRSKKQRRTHSRHKPRRIRLR